MKVKATPLLPESVGEGAVERRVVGERWVEWVEDEREEREARRTVVPRLGKGKRRAKGETSLMAALGEEGEEEEEGQWGTWLYPQARTSLAGSSPNKRRGKG